MRISRLSFVLRRCSPFIALLLVIALLMSGCACKTCGLADGRPPRPARINHLAFFKLKNPADAGELIADCDAHLARIPGIVSYYAGTHMDVGRTNIDGNYDVGFFVGFETEEAYREYVHHPSHVMVVEKWKPRWEWIRVHDVLDETP